MKETKIGYTFIVIASVVIVLAGVKSASSILVPFLLSLFIAIILSPSYNYFKSKKIPDGFSLLIVMGIFLFLIVLVVKLIGTSVTDFSSNIDMFSEKLSTYYISIVDYTRAFGLDLSINDIAGFIDSKKIMTFSTSLLQGMSALFTNGFVILLTVVFMLLESSHFMDKIDIADGKRGTLIHIQEIAVKIQHYMVLKAVISFFTGVIVWVVLSLIGTDYAFLWGVIAFIFNFIPNIGSIIAAVPAVLITLVQLGGFNALLVTGLYISVNIIMGSVIEPKVMGRGLGLSTLVVFLSLLFWGWLLGLVGMLLSIPLTIMAKIIFDTNENTRWISVLLGSSGDINKKKI